MTKSAIVTGAAKGIGAAIARRLATDGFAVVVNYRSSAAQAAGVVSAIEAVGGRAIAVHADLADAAATAELFDAAESAFGPVDVLVNNAGVLLTALLADVTDDDFQRQLTSNLTGTFNGMRESAKRIRDGGRIISLSTSIIGHYLPGYGVYVATKAAIEGMTHVLAKELGARGVAVNSVAPGPVATELLLAGQSAESIKILANMGRLGEPDDIARVVSFLAGPDGGWVSGQVVRVNGGRN